MLRDNLDRLRDDSRDERDRRDTRSYYFTDDANYDRAPQNEADYGEPRRVEYRREVRVERSRDDFSRDNFNQRLPETRNQNAQNFERGASDRRPAAAPNDDVAAYRRDEAAQPPRMQNSTPRNNDERSYTRDTARHWVDDDSHRSNPYYPTSSRIVETNQTDSRTVNRADSISPQPSEPRRQPRDNQSETARRGQDYGQTYFEQRAAITNAEQRSSNDARARNVMSRNVATVSPHDSVQHAARLMRDCDCGAIPVIDRSGRMIGMITDRDITVRLVAGGADARTAKTQDCMTTKVFACHENEKMIDFVRAMSEHQIRRIVVLDDQQRVVGIISQGDLARFAENNRSQHDEFTNLVNEISEPSRTSYR